MLETLRNELLQYINRMDESQIQILLGFVKSLLHFRD